MPLPPELEIVEPAESVRAARLDPPVTETAALATTVQLGALRRVPPVTSILPEMAKAQSLALGGVQVAVEPAVTVSERKP